MDISQLILISGFLLAAYSVVGNDVIQTLGTFLTSNGERKWYVLWAYAGGILAAVMIWGYIRYDGDVAYNRLDEIPLPEVIHWWYILPPLILMIITRFGLPVSTTFMILSTFSQKQIVEKMITKSVTGYIVAFLFAVVVYLLITKKFEAKFLKTPPTEQEKNTWLILQWCSTGLLWSQWLIQDLANIFVYLPRNLTLIQFALALSAILGLLGYIFYVRGGQIQKVVTSKTNTADLRSATIIDFTYAIVLIIFTELNPVPMSTTWAFIGVLAGREYTINMLLKEKRVSTIHRVVLQDLGKVIAGFVVSIMLVYIIRNMGGV